VSNVSSWHFSDLPASPPKVRRRGESGHAGPEPTRRVWKVVRGSQRPAHSSAGPNVRSSRAGRPMTDPEIGRKFLDQVCLRMPKADAEALLEETWRVHEAADAGTFARSLSAV